eukprot:TRINITY_DN2798_c0_g1_i1.p2 TRINITY_DN2798_c0_g1~~TRINITY_DN2798_c0_g1_i1.p2  ORF type:complete len:186 (-),score=45.45 TRINITY_DN2798_c0_g1_i1:167-724(-)
MCIRDRARTVQADLVQSLVLVLTVATFGTLVPPLMLLAPVSAWLQLCAMRFVERHQKHQPWGQVLASDVLAQVPVNKLPLALVGVCTVTCLLFADLQFDLGPVIFYAVFALLLAGVYIYRWGHNVTSPDSEGDFPNEAVDVEMNPAVLRAHSTRRSGEHPNGTCPSTDPVGNRAAEGGSSHKMQG